MKYEIKKPSATPSGREVCIISMFVNEFWRGVFHFWFEKSILT